MNIICIGAHPDDSEVFAGGTCVKWVRAGHRVLVVAMANGDVGHYEMGGGPLAQRRAAEAREAARRGGFEETILGNHDGELEVTLSGRKDVIRLIRKWEADIVVGLRSCDYHPDHRNAAVMVQDSAFLVTVPHYCPEVPYLKKNPVYLQMMDLMELTGVTARQIPFRPEIGVDVTGVMDAKWDILDAMESQVYEWLPWLDGVADLVPKNPRERRVWLEQAWGPYFRNPAQNRRDVLAKWYGAERAQQVEYAEFFEICEFGRQPEDDEIRELFAFPPA